MGRRCHIIPFFATKHFPKIMFFVLLSVAFFRNYGNIGCFRHGWRWRGLTWESVLLKIHSRFVFQNFPLDLTFHLVTLREKNIDEIILAMGKMTYFIDYLLSKPKAIYTSMHFYKLLSDICFNGWFTNCKMGCMSRTCYLKI